MARGARARIYDTHRCVSWRSLNPRTGHTGDMALSTDILLGGVATHR